MFQHILSDLIFAPPPRTSSKFTVYLLLMNLHALLNFYGDFFCPSLIVSCLKCILNSNSTYFERKPY